MIQATSASHQVEHHEETPLENPPAVSEPEMVTSDNIPGLAPPPAFQERFKFMICSSRLLKDRPNFDGARSMQTEMLPERRMTLAGLGIQDVSDVDGAQWNESILGAEGLRRRKAPSRELTVEGERQPASFRRASSSRASASTPSTPIFSSSSEHASHSGWEFLAYSPLVRALSPYMEPIILLLSSLIWIFEIVGWIWLELLAVSAIALCGCANIVVTISREKKQDRSRMGRRRSRESRKRETSDIQDEPEVSSDDKQATIDAMPPLEDEQRAVQPPTSPSRKEPPRNEIPEDSAESENVESLASVPPPTARVDMSESSTEPTSLQGMALETLQCVIQDAEEMDDVIAKAFSIIEASDM